MSLFFSFDGRIGRMYFWLLNLGLLVALGVGTVILGFAIRPISLSISVVLIVVLVVSVLISQLSVFVRRLHDRGKSGWWYLPYWILPSALLNISDRMPDTFVGLIPALAGLLITIWALIELGILKGAEGPNEYGADPLDPDNKSVASVFG